MKVYDAFLFSGEFDLLYLRVSELDAVVDYFVVVEATRTFQGQPRVVVPLENDPRLGPYLHKLRHIVLDDLPRDTTPWVVEFAQRNALKQGVASAAPTDLVILSDVDEIPNPRAVDQAALRPSGEILSLDMRFFYYGFNWEHPTRWDRARIVRAKLLDFVSPQELRSCPYPDAALADGGWHLSYFYKRKEVVEQIKSKARAFSHREFSTDKYLDDHYLAFCTTSGLSWCTSPRYALKLRYREIGDGHPEQVRVFSDTWDDYSLTTGNRDKLAEARAEVLHAASVPWQRLPAGLQRTISARARRR